MPNKFEEAATSAELWELLETEAGLQADDYDASVVAELRGRLELDAGAPMSDELKAKQISVERFVAAFFASVAPYVTMWSDLLALFELAAATTGASNLRVAYRFDEAGQLDLDFDLDHFRRVAEIVEQMMVPFDLSGPDTPQLIWGVTYAVDRGAWDRPSGEPEVDRFDTICRDPHAPWPASMPAIPRTGDRRLDELISEAWTLASRFLAGLRSISSDHASLMAEVSYDDLTSVVDGASAATIRLVESDYWLPTTAVAFTNVSKAPHAQPDLAGRLEAALAPLRNTDPRLLEPRRRLSEFLQLPIWKQRYELYSNWVCTQIIRAIDDQAARVHADRGEIRFAFSGTHLATFDAFMPRLHLWAELRVPLEDPVGEHRSSAIQPDVTLLADPITARRSPLAVECKQYKKASSKNFADAITDYAHGHAEARIILVNYGPARAATVLKHVARDVVPRAVVIGDVRPGESKPLSVFRSEVRGAVGLPAEFLSRPSVCVPGQITLRWGTAPRDLDLHVSISRPGEEDHHIYHRNLGSLDAAPFCSLQRDVTDGQGPEVITVTRWLPRTYEVVVNNYSNEIPLGGSGAIITIDYEGTQVEFQCPEDITSQDWAVCSIDGASGEMANLISPTR
jgi:hypothetical protein